MHFHFRQGKQDSESPPSCTAFHGGTHIHHEQSRNSQSSTSVAVSSVCGPWTIPGSLTTALLQWRPGEGLRDPRTALPDADRPARGEGYLSATSSSPRPLALVPPVFRKRWMAWWNGGPLQRSCRIVSATPWRWLSLCARYQGLHARRMVRCDYSDVEQAWGAG